MEAPVAATVAGGSAPKCYQKKAEFAHYHLQKRSLTLLLVGATCGFLGFLCSTIIGIHKFLFTPTGINYLGETFASGNNYRPQTVSEMVHNQDSPEGKAFFAFCLMGAICILASWYSWQLRNVYVGDSAVVCSRWGPAWANVRHYLPPLGMLLVVCIPVTPPAQRDFGEVFAVSMHSLGAVAMIGGYGITELHCLLFAQATKDRDVFFKPGEWCQRVVVASLSIFCGVAFQVCGLIAEYSTRWSCADDWRFPNEDELAQVSSNRSSRYLEVTIAEAIRHHRKLLYNTAYAECLVIKTGEFWFEVLAGFFMICSLWSIWYFSLERHIKMPERLPDVPRHFLRSQGYSEDYVRRGSEEPEGGGALGPEDVRLEELAGAGASGGGKCQECFGSTPLGQLPAQDVVPGATSGPSTDSKAAPAYCWFCF